MTKNNETIFSGFVEIINSQGGFTVGGAPNAAEDGGEISETTSSKTVTFVDDSEHEVPSRTLSYIQRNPTQLPSFLGKIFVFAYTWAFGGNLHPQSFTEDDEDKSRSAKENPPVWQLFDNLVRDLFEIDAPIGVELPPGNDSIANYYIDMESGHFALWSNLVPSTRALIAKAVSSQFAISDSLNALDDPPPLKNQIEVDRSLAPTVDFSDLVHGFERPTGFTNRRNRYRQKCLDPGHVSSAVPSGGDWHWNGDYPGRGFSSRQEKLGGQYYRDHIR